MRWHSRVGTLGPVWLLLSCYSGYESPPFALELPDGHVVLFRKALPDGAIVQISVSQEAYDADPSSYAGISVDLDNELEDPAASNAFIGLVDGVVELSPEGAQFESPVYLQVLWPSSAPSAPSTATLEDAKWYLYDRSIEIWRPLATSVDVSHRTGGVWLEHFSEYKFGLPLFQSVESVALLEPAVEGVDVEFRMNTTLGPGESIDCTSNCGNVSIDGERVTISSVSRGLHELVIKEGAVGKWMQQFYVSPSDMPYGEWSALAVQYRPAFLPPPSDSRRDNHMLGGYSSRRRGGR